MDCKLIGSNRLTLLLTKVLLIRFTLAPSCNLIAPPCMAKLFWKVEFLIVKLL